jgi:hypothetical protein
MESSVHYEERFVRFGFDALNGQGHCAHLWTLVFAVWDCQQTEQWWLIDCWTAFFQALESNLGNSGPVRYYAMVSAVWSTQQNTKKLDYSLNIDWIFTKFLS